MSAYHLCLGQQPTRRGGQQRLPACNRLQCRGVDALGGGGRKRGRQAAQRRAQRAQRGVQHAVHAGPRRLDVVGQLAWIGQAVKPRRDALQVQTQVCTAGW